MKKIVSFIISMTLVLAVLPSAVSAETAEDGILGILSELNIMKGDPDGNLRLGDAVSRAEFTKMAVAASTYKNSVATNLAISPFPDVTYQYWGAPYVRVGVTNGIVSGYPDGMFRPEETVLFEEAVTMILRVLGYSNDDFGNSWPSGQLGIADNIDLTDDVDCSEGDTMTRRQVAKLIYNALKTEMKSSGILANVVFNVTITDDTTIIATHNEDTSIASDSVMTSAGTYKLDVDISSAYVGLSGDLAVKDNKKVIGFVPDDSKGSSDEYIVYSVLDSAVLVYKNGTISQIDLNDNTLVYKGTATTTFAQIKSELEMGDKLIVRRLSAGDIDYITYVGGNVKGPVTAVGGSWMSVWNLDEGVSVTRNGVLTTGSAIQNYDVVYYLPDLNTVLAYSNKVTGVYEKASPSKDTVTTVTVSGKDYALEGSNAFSKVHSGGTFEYGDTVTLLLGKDGKVADVISPSATADGVVGYLVGTGTKEYSSGDVNTYTNYYIRLVATDGVEYEYVTDRDYKESVNSVVELSFSNGYARVSNIKSPSNISGEFNWSSKKLGSDTLSASVEILDVGTQSVSEQSIYAKVFGQRLDGVKIPSKSVLYEDKNQAGEIEKLVLYDVTGDAYRYGIVTNISKGGNISAYAYTVDGERYTTSGTFSVSLNAAVKIAGSLQNPDYIQGLTQVSGKITSISSDRLIAGGASYKISDKASVYTKKSGTNGEYTIITLSELIENLADYNIFAAYDKVPESGGRIRVIVAVEKE